MTSDESAALGRHPLGPVEDGGPEPVGLVDDGVEDGDAGELGRVQGVVGRELGLDRGAELGVDMRVLGVEQVVEDEGERRGGRVGAGDDQEHAVGGEVGLRQRIKVLPGAVFVKLQSTPTQKSAPTLSGIPGTSRVKKKKAHQPRKDVLMSTTGPALLAAQHLLASEAHECELLLAEREHAQDAVEPGDVAERSCYKRHRQSD